MRYSKLRRTRRNVQKTLCVNARLCCPCIICNYAICNMHLLICGYWFERGAGLANFSSIFFFISFIE